MTDQTLVARVAALEDAHRELINLLIDNGIICERAPTAPRLLSRAVADAVHRARGRLAGIRSE